MANWLIHTNYYTILLFSMKMGFRLQYLDYSSLYSDFISLVPFWKLTWGTNKVFFLFDSVDSTFRCLFWQFEQFVSDSFSIDRTIYIFRCSSSLTARVHTPDHPTKLTQHSHQEIARVTAGGSLLRAGKDWHEISRISIFLEGISEKKSHKIWLKLIIFYLKCFKTIV